MAGQGYDSAIDGNANTRGIDAGLELQFIHYVLP